jgi:undecaprenyl-diphosphatase
MADLNHFLFRLINGVWVNPVLDSCMIFINRINEYGLLWLVLLGMLATLGGRTGRWAALAGLVALVVGLASSEVLKNLVKQPRPFLSLANVRLLVDSPNSYSFPSVNVTYAFAACSGALLTVWRLFSQVPLWGWGYLILSAALSYSRVYVGVHYPSDVLGGALLGISVGWLVATIVVRIGKHKALGR